LSATIFQIGAEQVTDDQRSAAKPANFGLPAGMGARTFRSYFLTSVRHDGKLTPEKKAELEAWATPENCQKAVDAWFATWPEMRTFLEKDDRLFEEIARFFELTPENYELFTNRSVRGDDYREPAAWLGGMFFKFLRTEGVPTTRQGEEYGRDQLAFFWTMLERKADMFPKKTQTLIGKRQRGYALFQAIRNHVTQAAVFCLSGRLRSHATYCARHNTVFQGLASDGACHAMWLLWRAGYTISNFVHDQFVVEVSTDQDLRPHIERIKSLMIQAMQEVVPDVRVDVDAVVAASWAKQDVLKLDDGGRPSSSS
jgi:hypothetical protein